MQGLTGAEREPEASRRAWPPSPATGRLALVSVVGAGVALRYAAGLQAPESAEWEADAFLCAWGGTGSRALAGGCRPPGLALVWESCGWLTRAPSLVAMRTAAIGMSLLLLACAWELVRAWLRWRDAGPEARARAGLSLAVGWAAWPALAWSGPCLVAEPVAGGAVCLLAGALLRYRMATRWTTWVWLCLTGTLGVAIGGTVVWVALTTGLLAWLVTLPRAPLALPLLGAWIVSMAAAVGIARAHDDSRPWRPDVGPAYALADLAGATLVLDDRESLLSDLRGDAVWRASRKGLTEQPAHETLAALGRRAQALIAPSRWTGVAGPVLGGLDALLAGSVLALAASTLGRRTAGRTSRAARIATGLAALAWLVATAAGATGPFALTGVLLVALALAVADAAAGPAVRWPAAAAGGALGLACAFVPASGERPGAPWLDQLTQLQGQGRQLVALLAAGESASGPEHLQLSQLLMDPGAPFLRRPQLALEQAREGFRQTPTDEAVLVLVRAETDCLRFSQAEDLTLTLVDHTGAVTPGGRMLGDWVRDKARRARLDGLR